MLLHKPYGVLCQFTGAAGVPTLRDFVAVRGVYPAGRLDADSEGLVVLTARGQVQARIADPRHRLPKTYWVQVEGAPSPEALARLGGGIDLADGLPTLRLVRWSVGPWTLAVLAPGQWRRACVADLVAAQDGKRESAQ